MDGRRLTLAICAPDARSRAELQGALASDSSIEVVDGRRSTRDIDLIHFDVVRNLPGAMALPQRNARVVVAFAPNNPAQLALLLASGVHGYHRRGESWSQLLAVLHTVGDGDVRSDPRTMNELLIIYRRMLRNTS